MAQSYDNTNTGVLFKNDSENEKAPQYKGKIDVGGKEYQLAAWVRESKSGAKFMSLKLDLPHGQQHTKSMGDDVPF